VEYLLHVVSEYPPAPVYGQHRTRSLVVPATIDAITAVEMSSVLEVKVKYPGNVDILVIGGGSGLPPH
jgi:hypothetical protein